MGFEFNNYELWPSQLTVDPATLPVPVRPAGPNELTVGSLNLFRLFGGDTLATSKLAAYIHDVLRSPDILASAGDRAAKGRTGRYTQIRIDGADHFFNGRNEILLKTIEDWIEAL